METFRDPNFLTFLQTLQERTGYEPNSYDLFYNGDSKLANVFNNTDLAEISNKSANIEVHIGVDELLIEVMRIVKNIDFSDKFKVIRDIIDKVIVTERSGAEIWAHLSLPVTITEKLGYGLKRRDKTIQSPTLDFKFNLHLPSPRKVRIITQRDKCGRILRSIPPEMSFETTFKPFYSLLQG